MPVNYTIQASIVDIRVDRPKPTDVLLVDSNVWYWTTYFRADQGDRPPQYYQKKNYPEYVTKALRAKARLYWCGLSLAEVAHLIEATEREIFNRTNSSLILSKEYRHNYPAQRQQVVTEIQAAWTLVKRYGQSLDLLIDNAATDAILARSQTQPLDGYDLLILEAISRAGISQVITDDADFVTVPGLQVFTSGNSVITAAQTQGKLVRR